MNLLLLQHFQKIHRPWEKTHIKYLLVSHCEGSRPTLITTYYKFVCGTTLQIRVCIFWRLAVIQAAALLSNQSFFWHVDSSSSFLIRPYVNRLNLWYMYMTFTIPQLYSKVGQKWLFVAFQHLTFQIVQATEI